MSITVRSFLLPLARLARARGWTVGLAANGDLVGELPSDAADRLHPLGWRRTPASWHNFVAWWRLRTLLREYDVVHCHTPVAAWITRLAAASLRARPHVIYTAHGLHLHPEGGAVHNVAIALLERIAAQWTDHLIVINEHDHQASSKVGYRSSRVTAIPGVGIAGELLRAAAAAAPSREEVLPGAIPVDAPVVTVVAELTVNKQHHVAIEALALMRARRVHLLLVGEGPERARLTALAVAHGVAHRVHLLGYRHDVPALLRHSDVVLLTSAREGLPVSLMEAMAIGTPCVGSDIRGIRDLLDGGCGRVFPNGDTQACARALDATITDTASAAAIVHAARRRAAGLDIEVVVPRNLELYERARVSAVEPRSRAGT